MSSRARDRLSETAQVLAKDYPTAEGMWTALGQQMVDVADKDMDIAPLQAEFWLYAVRHPEVLETFAAQPGQSGLAADPLRTPSRPRSPPTPALTSSPRPARPDTAARAVTGAASPKATTAWAVTTRAVSRAGPAGSAAGPASAVPARRRVDFCPPDAIAWHPVREGTAGSAGRTESASAGRLDAGQARPSSHELGTRAPGSRGDRHAPASRPPRPGPAPPPGA